MVVGVVTNQQLRNFHIPVLHLIKSAQNQHGLRHGDYRRYQQYVSRKLRRMRKSLRFQQGTRSRVVPKKLNAEIITDSRFLLLSVFEIERSWSFAMQLKTESNTEPRKRFQMLSRLRKASNRAKILFEIINSVNFCDAQTKLEFKAYTSWICGILCFEMQDWLRAKDHLESSQSIYSGLAVSVDEDIRPAYNARINELLPQMRYCAYSIGDKSAAADLQEMRHAVAAASSSEGAVNPYAEYELDELLKQVAAMRAANVSEVTWLGTRIPVKLEKVRVAIISVQEVDNDIKKAPSIQAKMAMCESVLKCLVEAIATVRDELKTLFPDSVSATVRSAAVTNLPTGSVDKVSRTQRLLTYLQYLKLEKTISRTLLQIESTIVSSVGGTTLAFAPSYHKPHELSRLYDTIVQSLQDVLALPGQLQEMLDLKSLLRSKMSAYRSIRCFYLALAYLQEKKFVEASALLTRCQLHANFAAESLSVNSLCPEVEAESAPGHPAKDLLQLMSALLKEADSEILICKAGHMLEVAGGGVESTENTCSEAALKEPLVNSLDEFIRPDVLAQKLSKLPSPLVPMPPEFEPVPVKPVFFDLALNHINFPPTPKASDSSNPAVGITGFIGGLLWGSKSHSKT